MSMFGQKKNRPIGRTVSSGSVFGNAPLQLDRQRRQPHPQQLDNYKPVDVLGNVHDTWFGAFPFGATPFGATPYSATPLSATQPRHATPSRRATPSISTSFSSATPLSANADLDASTAFGGVFSSGSSPGIFNWSIDSQNPSTDPTLFAAGSVGFSAGKHLWKVQIFGSVLQGLCFGIRNHIMSNESLLGNWWVWSSKQVHQLHPMYGGQARRESTITDLASGDTIELYLDCEQRTLMMYNPRTKQSDTLDEVTGEVSPVFRMTTHEDKVSLKVQMS